MAWTRVHELGSCIQFLDLLGKWTRRSSQRVHERFIVRATPALMHASIGAEDVKQLVCGTKAHPSMLPSHAIVIRTEPMLTR